MSRGLGSVQRAVLERINTGDLSHGEQGFVTMRQLSEAVYGDAELTPPRVVALRRALRGLEAAGLIDEWARGGGTYQSKVWPLRAPRPKGISEDLKALIALRRSG